MVEGKERKEGISKSIHITRVPIKSYETFMKMAYDEFAGDYGMLLKNLVDSKELLNKILCSMAPPLPEETTEPEDVKIEEPENVKKMLSGKEIKGGKEE